MNTPDWNNGDCINRTIVTFFGNTVVTKISLNFSNCISALASDIWVAKPSWIMHEGWVEWRSGCTRMSTSPRCTDDDVDDDEVLVAVARLITAQHMIACCTPVEGWVNNSRWGNKLSPRGAAWNVCSNIITPPAPCDDASPCPCACVVVDVVVGCSFTVSTASTGVIVKSASLSHWLTPMTVLVVGCDDGTRARMVIASAWLIVVLSYWPEGEEVKC